MDPKLTEHYKAKQAKPVFFKEDPELASEEAWGSRLVLLAIGAFVLGFTIVFAFVALKGYIPFPS